MFEPSATPAADTRIFTKLLLIFLFFVFSQSLTPPSTNKIGREVKSIWKIPSFHFFFLSTFGSPTELSSILPRFPPAAMVIISFAVYFNLKGFLIFCFFINAKRGIVTPAAAPVAARNLSVVVSGVPCNKVSGSEFKLI